MTHDNTGAVIPKFKQIGATAIADRGQPPKWCALAAAALLRAWNFTSRRAGPKCKPGPSRVAIGKLEVTVAAANELGGAVVIKIQAWTTGRARIGGWRSRRSGEASARAERMLAMTVGQFPVETVLVEEKIAIDREFFLSFAIDDAVRAPIIIFSPRGGSGIEERAAATRRIGCEVNSGPLDAEVKEAAGSFGLSAGQASQLGDWIRKLCRRAQRNEASTGLVLNPETNAVALPLPLPMAR